MILPLQLLSLSPRFIQAIIQMRILLLSWVFLMSSLGYNFFGITIAFVSGQCESDQQTLLLQMKSSLIFDPSSSVKLMQWKQNTDCCDWSGVDCDEAGHVIGLDLSTESISGGIETAAGLFSLHFLRSLNLARTSFNGTQIPSRLANISSLTYLNLSDAGFAGQIPFQISSMTRLVALDFSFNHFSGSISSIRWEHLLNLVYVVLSDNSLNGNIPQSLFELPMLQQLQLANNQFDGSIPRFSNASSSVLDTIDLSGNRLGGSIPISVFELKKLTSLVLSLNNLHGAVQLDKILSLGNLAKLDLSYNSLAVDASSRNYSFSPMLEFLNLASCKLREIPNLKNQTQLQYLYLAENQISGEIPNWIWQVSVVGLHCLNLSHNLLVGFQEPYSIPALRFIDLSSNQLRGNIHHLPHNAIYMDFSHNNFTSSIPADIGNFMPGLRYFCAANNGFTGVIPTSLCNATTLSLLDLSNNSLSGSIPACLMKKGNTIFVLNLQRNNLNGTLPDTFPENCLLQTLDLNGNRLQGAVSKSIANCKMLEVLNLGNNQFSDKFPCWLHNASSLHVLVLRSNNFSGYISCPENNVSWPMLQIIDLASNKFSGRISNKWLLNLEGMMVDEGKSQAELRNLRYELKGNNYYQVAVTVTIKGLDIKLQKILNIFTSMDFSTNNFEGPIPEGVGLLKSLYGLNLSHNALTGSIPSSFGNLKQIESLDLSMNNLSGAIPSQLASLYFLSYLNLSYNHLVGQIPIGTQMQTFLPTSFEGNQGLCGPPLTNNCQTNSSELVPLAPPASRDEMDWFFIIMATGFAVGFGTVVATLMFSRNVNRWYNDLIYRFLNRW